MAYRVPPLVWEGTIAVCTATERTEIPFVDSRELQKLISFLNACAFASESQGRQMWLESAHKQVE